MRSILIRNGNPTRAFRKLRRAVLRSESVGVYIDEVYMLNPRCPALTALYTQGGVGIEKTFKGFNDYSVMLSLINAGYLFQYGDRFYATRAGAAAYTAAKIEIEEQEFYLK